MNQDHIILKGAKTHNLRGVDCKIPHGRLTVVTGVSGSGKSSLAFDTLYAEGQRRYTESLSTYARQFLQRMAKPPFRELRFIQPAVALRQKNEVTNARSTVSTVTEIDDHLGLLLTHAGTTHCPKCDAIVRRDTVASALARILRLEEGTKLVIVGRVTVDDQEHRGTVLRQHIQEGFRRLYIDSKAVDISDEDIETILDLETYPFVIDRVVVNRGDVQRLTEALEVGMGLGKGRLEVYVHKADEALVFDRAFRCNSCDYDLVEPQPALFSFNSSIGACPNCSGFGRTIGLDFGKIIPNPNRTLEEGAVVCFSTPKYKKWQTKLLSACRQAQIAVDLPFRKLPAASQRFVKSGGKGWIGIRGIFEELKQKQHKVHIRVFLAKYRGFDECEACDGSRLSPDARATYVNGKNLADIWDMSITDARDFFADIELGDVDRAKVDTVLSEIQHRVSYLHTVGLGYLELKRPSRTLSGGEMQRIHLTTNLGRALTDTLYVLDEPTAGLHARDSQRLLQILHHLRDLGNTVIVVEHDPEIIEGGDWVIELGPKGGEAGGELTFEGDLKSFLTSDTITGGSLRTRLALNKEAPPSQESVRILGAAQHNLDGIDVSIPTGRLTAISGVSGSGKSTLMHSVLYNGWRALAGHGGVEKGAAEALEGLEAFEEVVMMDQGALGRSSRSNPLSYTKAYDDVRKEFSQTKQAQLHGITARDFSFNTPGGRCETCQGLGTVTIEMHFMADIDVVCEECNGRRFRQNVLDIEYRGKNIADVFLMTVQEGLEFFRNSRPIRRKLQPLIDVGLGYLRLGQTTSTLSGGEAQRLKLATYIAQGTGSKKTRPIFFIFDEPTVGLHLKDVETLLVALRKLIEQGHSVAVIEHNIDFIANCDHVIDLGPGAGPEGGNLVATGTPSEVARTPQSVTGTYLAEFLAEASAAASA